MLKPRHAFFLIACGALAAPVLAQPAAPASPVVSAPQDAAAHEWQVQVRQRVMRAARAERNWPPGKHEIVIGFRVARDGSISEPSLIVGTGRPEIDAQPAAMLRRVGRMPAFPDSMPEASRYVRIPVTFHIEDTSPVLFTEPDPHHYEDSRNGWSVTVPATLTILGPRTRPGFVSVLSVGAKPEGPQPVPGTTRLCDIALRPQQPALAERNQAQLNQGTHQATIAETLLAGYGARGEITSPDHVTFGRAVRGQEMQLTPTDAPETRRYVALADTPAYRLAVTCGTTAEDIDRALPLFRALAARLVVDGR
ncbi:hypothetical protein IMZ29_13025 [Achromobacter sp. GG226]|uniref:TonB C-terminal domain-containing protein n=1 Tax=Verticiella alkaliphila TaxID=2779529 RepID=UPI001C0D98A3|nr:TonB C-terminal domain-containing protein [Verticiella sp. GG226]MBU4611417.1 hypothetical protein [Verticiella sp. GG226]